MIEVAATIIEYEGKLLAFQRCPSKFEYVSNKFEFPGGKVEENEDEKEALKRELLEEFEISSKIDKYITESFYEYDKNKINLRAYSVKHLSGDFKLNDHDRIEWITIEELAKYDFAPADVPINNYLIKNGL